MSDKKQKPIRLFESIVGYVDHPEGMQVTITGYGGCKDLIATTSLVVGPLQRNDKQEVVRFETMNSIYVRRNLGSATP